MYTKTSDEAHSQKLIFAKKAIFSEFAKDYVWEIFSVSQYHISTKNKYKIIKTIDKIR